jgi:hypothetical protein
MIKMTPPFVITFVANIVLKGVAQLKVFQFDLENRTLYVATRLLGEPEDIILKVENFGVVSRGGKYFFILRSAQSNKPWLTNLMSHVTNQHWPIPAIPQITPYMGLINEILELP